MVVDHMSELMYVFSCTERLGDCRCVDLLQTLSRSCSSHSRPSDLMEFDDLAVITERLQTELMQAAKVGNADKVKQYIEQAG